MKIGVLFRPDVPNVFYRAVGPAEALRAAGHDVVTVMQDERDRFDLGGLRQCDVVHVYRRGDASVLAAVQDLQRRGVAVTWDNDDDIRLIPAENAAAKGLTRLDIKKDFDAQKKMLRRVDAVTTTSAHLERAYRGLTDAPVQRIENYLLPMQYPRAAGSHHGFVIGWIAGREHHADAQALDISGALGRILERHPEVRVVSVGVRLRLPEERYTHIVILPFEDLGSTMRNFDVAIAPIADIPMSYARSNVKVKEYAAAGTPWLASARGPYEGLGEQQGGMLVADDAWERALETLLTSRFKRWRLARRAAAWGKTQALERHVDEWVDTFETAIAARSARLRDSRGAAGHPETSGARRG